MSSPGGDVRFAPIVYLVAGTVGLLEIVPLYFLESTVNRMQPPAINFQGSITDLWVSPCRGNWRS